MDEKSLMADEISATEKTELLLQELWKSGKRWHIVATIILGYICYITYSIHVFCIVFTGMPPKEKCVIKNSTNYGNITTHSILICATTVQNGSCPEVYVEKPEGLSIMTDFGLFCGQEYMVPLSQTIMFIGIFIGSLMCSDLIDVWGRKPVMVITQAATALLTAGLIACNDIYTYSVLRFLSGVTIATYFTAALIYVVEMFPSSNRKIPNLLYSFMWTLGMALLALIAYLNRNWRIIHGCNALASVLGCGLQIWFLPEAMPWLLANDQPSRARKLANWIIRFNGQNGLSERTTSCIKEQEDIVKSRESIYNELNQKAGEFRISQLLRTYVRIIKQRRTRLKGRNVPGFRDMWAYKRLLLRLLGACVLSACIGLTYPALAYFSGVAEGDIYMNFFLSTLIEAIAYPVLLPVSMFVRRKLVLTTLFALVAICLGLTIALQSVVRVEIINVLAFAGKAIIGFITTLFNPYTPELFPTRLRGLGSGITFAVGRFFGVLAPFYVPLGKLCWWIPPAIATAMCVLSVVASILLPSTDTKVLLTDINDMKEQQRKKSLLIEQNK